MERELGISYPTVRARVEALVRALGFGPRADAVADDDDAATVRVATANRRRPARRSSSAWLATRSAPSRRPPRSAPSGRTRDDRPRPRLHAFQHDSAATASSHSGSAAATCASAASTAIEATVRSTDGRSLDGLVIDAADRSLSISADPADDRLLRRANRSPELDIELPVGTTIVVEVNTADIEAAGFHGDQRYHSTSGNVDLRGVHGTLDGRGRLRRRRRDRRRAGGDRRADRVRRPGTPGRRRCPPSAS